MKQRLVELISLQEVTTAPRVLAGEVDVSADTVATVFIRMGRTVTSAHSAGVEYRIELSPDRTGNRWGIYNSPTTGSVGTSVATEVVKGACAAKQDAVGMESTTGFTVGDVVFIENTTFASSEFGKVKKVTAGTSVTLEDSLVNAQTGSTVFDQAEIKTPVIIDVRSAARLRVVVDGSGAGQNFAIDAQVLLAR